MTTPGDFIQMTCGRCQVIFYLPNDLYRSACRDENISFYCPHGHQRHFPSGETNEAKLRRERDRLKQEQAQLNDEIRRQRELRDAAERSAAAYKGQTTRLKNRVKAGLCPCCNRHFDNLQRHIATKHPDISIEGDGVVVPLLGGKSV